MDEVRLGGQGLSEGRLRLPAVCVISGGPADSWRRVAVAPGPVEALSLLSGQPGLYFGGPAEDAETAELPVDSEVWEWQRRVRIRLAVLVVLALAMLAALDSAWVDGTISILGSVLLPPLALWTARDLRPVPLVARGADEGVVVTRASDAFCDATR